MKVSNPERPLDKAKDISKADYFCLRISPYLIGLFTFILLVLALVILVKYGALWFGTEANHWYYGDLV